METILVLEVSILYLQRILTIKFASPKKLKTKTIEYYKRKKYENKMEN